MHHNYGFPNAQANQAFPLMPANASYAPPPFPTCAPRQRREIDAVMQRIIHEIDLQELAGNFGGPFNHWVAYARNGCGCGRDHQVIYEFSCAPAAPADPGVDFYVSEVRRTPTHLTFLFPNYLATVTAIRFAAPPNA